MSTATGLLLRRAGISYRQLDYWVRQGLIEPRFHSRGHNRVDLDHGGSGVARSFSAHEERVVLRMGRLVNAGIAPDVAARIARNSLNKGGYYQLLDLLKIDEGAP